MVLGNAVIHELVSRAADRVRIPAHVRQVELKVHVIRHRLIRSVLNVIQIGAIDRVNIQAGIIPPSLRVQS